MTATTTTVTTGAITEPTELPWRAALWLLVLQAAQMAIPLVSLPFLARTLGPEAWGRVASAQSLAMMAGLVVEYGFNLSGARQVARHRDDPERLRAVFSSILSAQVFLLGGVAALVVGTQPWNGLPDLFWGWSAIAWMTPQVVSLQWYFQGVEQMARLAGWILAGRIAGVAGVLALVRGPDDAVLSLLVPGVCGLLALVLAAREPWRRLRPRPAALGEVLEALGDGRRLCVYRLGLALQGTAHPYLLALWLGPAAAGFFAGAERLARAAMSGLEPLLVIAFPRAAYLQAQGQERAAEKVERKSRMVALAAGLGVGAALFCAAPALTGLLLGPGYEESERLLRILSLWPVANLLCQLRGQSGLAARGRDGAMTGAAMGAGVLQLAGAAGLVYVLPSGAPAAIAAWMVAGQFLHLAGLEWLRGRET